MIANVPVIVLASTDHKVLTGLSWFKEKYEGNYYLANSISDAYNFATGIIASNKFCKNEPYFEKMYYENLRTMVEEL